MTTPPWKQRDAPTNAAAPPHGAGRPARPAALRLVPAAAAVLTLWAAGRGLAAEANVFEDPPTACAAVARRWADPGAVRLGDSVTVTTHVAVTCPAPLGIDVALVIDRSPSMRGAPLADAQAAAEAFVAGLDPAVARVGLVTFSSTASIDARLSRDDRYLRGAIRAIEVPERGGTDIHDGLWLAGRLLAADGDGRAQAIVLVSDGRNGAGPVPAIQQAAIQRQAGRHLVTVALGIQADVALMGALATSADDALVAPRSADLVDRLRRVARRLAAVEARDVILIEPPPATAPYLSHSARPPAEFDGSSLRWRFPLMPRDGITTTYRVRPLRAGRQAVSDGGMATFDAGGDALGSVALPAAWVVVWDGEPTAFPTSEPTATAAAPSPSATATPTASATLAVGEPTPGARAPVFLPFLDSSDPGRRASSAAPAGRR